MTWIIIAVLVLGFLIWFSFNPDAQRIRKIQSLLNKDRTICDFINTLDGWKIEPNLSSDKGLRIMINPVVVPMYALYITYKERRPTNDEIKVLYNRLTSKDSIVTKAHEMDMPVENYIHWLKNNVE